MSIAAGVAGEIRDAPLPAARHGLLRALSSQLERPYRAPAGGNRRCRRAPRALSALRRTTLNIRTSLQCLSTPPGAICLALTSSDVTSRPSYSTGSACHSRSPPWPSSIAGVIGTLGGIDRRVPRWMGLGGDHEGDGHAVRDSRHPVRPHSGRRPGRRLAEQCDCHRGRLHSDIRPCRPRAGAGASGVRLRHGWAGARIFTAQTSLQAHSSQCCGACGGSDEPRICLGHHRGG